MASVDYFFISEADRSPLCGHVAEVRAVSPDTCSVSCVHEVTPWLLGFLDHSSWAPGLAGIVQDSDFLSFVQKWQVYLSTRLVMMGFHVCMLLGQSITLFNGCRHASLW